ncbi:MAG: prolipoprotein diacylglyceryl transferase [Desulfobulbus sp.]|nr:prolipoprotein diacylglyceryl transferase [Desulfobulbus sp.]
MIQYPNIDPILLSVGPLQIRWYGLMYIIGFAAAYWLVLYQAKRFGWKQLIAHVDNLNLALIIGVILGGRLGYVAIYNPGYYLTHPMEIPATWSGGMSFHGGCIGALLAGFWYCRRTKLNYWKAVDLYIATVPIGLFFGRMGNFINGELYGRISTAPWAMIFPGGGSLPRHPSQLYEALLEGILLFILLWSLKARPWQPGKPNWPHGSLLALFLCGYGFCRFIVEFFREPDVQLGFIVFHFSMGQILCGLMIVVGVALWVGRKQAKRQE